MSVAPAPRLSAGDLPAARVRGTAIQDRSLGLDPRTLDPRTLDPRTAASPDDEGERLADWAVLGRAVLLMEGCPGVLVVHANGVTECVEGTGCPPDPSLHVGTVSCAELPGCC